MSTPEYDSMSGIVAWVHLIHGALTAFLLWLIIYVAHCGLGFFEDLNAIIETHGDQLHKISERLDALDSAREKTK